MVLAALDAALIWKIDAINWFNTPVSSVGMHDMPFKSALSRQTLCV